MKFLINDGPKSLVLFWIAFYQRYVRILLPQNRCIYEPSCSSYALEAVEKHGPWKGSRLAVARLLKCHPFEKGGYDPVP